MNNTNTFKFIDESTKVYKNSEDKTEKYTTYSNI